MHTDNERLTAHPDAKIDGAFNGIKGVNPSVWRKKFIMEVEKCLITFPKQKSES
jgi:hypothetical protein